MPHPVNGNQKVLGDPAFVPIETKWPEHKRASFTSAKRSKPNAVAYQVSGLISFHCNLDV